MYVTNQPNCFGVTVAPIYVTSGQTGLITAKFRNVFGSATATHTVITLKPLPAEIVATAVSARYIRASGASRDVSAGCSQPPAQPLSCSFGNVAQGDTAVMFIRVTNSVATGSLNSVTGTLYYAEGNGSNGNDSFDAVGTAESVSGSNKAGYCTTSITNKVKNKTVPLVSTTGSSSGQTSTIESLAALATGLPCTPVTAAVDEEQLSGGPNPTPVSIVAFPATGTVTLLFPLSELGGADATTFVLYELSIDDGVTWIELSDCPAQAPGTDSCISSQTNVTKNGVKYVQDVLTVVGSPPDGHYGG
jgi:hypothetical protein